MTIRSSLLASMAAAFVPCWVAAQTVQDVSFVNSQGVRLTAKYYQPAWSGPHPAIVMLHGCSGIFSYSDVTRGIARLYTEWAGRLNAAGYAALLPDSFGPRGSAQNQCGNGAAGVSEVSDRPEDAYAARAFLASRTAEVDAGRIALLGWSHGASSAFAAMSTTMRTRVEGRFRGALTFYPGCGLYNAFGGISTSTYAPYAPLTMFHGDADPLYQSGYCQTRVQRAQYFGSSVANGNPMELLVYPGAKHSFDNARVGDSSFTSYDLNAKSAADTETMSRLSQILR